MSLMMVPSLEPGERSLPAELRTRRGEGFARRRMANQLRGVSGIGSYGDCLQYDDTGECSEFDVSNPPSDAVTSPTLPVESIASILNQSNPDQLTAAQQAQVAQAVQQRAVAPAGYAGPKILAPGVAAPTPPSGYQWAQVLSQSGQGLAQVLAVAQGGSTVTLPNGAKMIYGSPQSAAAGSGLFSSGNVFGSANLGNMLPLLLILGVGFLVLGNRGR